MDVKGLNVRAGDVEIIGGIDLAIKPGEVHVIMGQNGSGKTTLLHALAGHPKYSATGSARFCGKDLLSLKPHERARAGLFLAFQHPNEVQGVALSSFLRRAYVASHGKEISVPDFERLLLEKMALLGMDRKFAARGLNEGFSGGEKKRSEMLQLAVLEPKLAMLDELDSGLDVDALSDVSGFLENIRKAGASLLIVTHYSRILRGLKPDAVHVMRGGKIIASGDSRLADKLEEKGYGWIDKSV